MSNLCQRTWRSSGTGDFPAAVPCWFIDRTMRGVSSFKPHDKMRKWGRNGDVRSARIGIAKAPLYYSEIRPFARASGVAEDTDRRRGLGPDRGPARLAVREGERQRPDTRIVQRDVYPINYLCRSDCEASISLLSALMLEKRHPFIYPVLRNSSVPSRELRVVFNFTDCCSNSSIRKYHKHLANF